MHRRNETTEALASVQGDDDIPHSKGPWPLTARRSACPAEAERRGVSTGVLGYAKVIRDAQRFGDRHGRPPKVPLRALYQPQTPEPVIGRAVSLPPVAERRGVSTAVLGYAKVIHDAQH